MITFAILITIFTAFSITVFVLAYKTYTDKDDYSLGVSDIGRLSKKYIYDKEDIV